MINVLISINLRWAVWTLLILHQWLAVKFIKKYIDHYDYFRILICSSMEFAKGAWAWRKNIEFVKKMLHAVNLQWIIFIVCNTLRTLCSDLRRFFFCWKRSWSDLMIGFRERKLHFFHMIKMMRWDQLLEYLWAERNGWIKQKSPINRFLSISSQINFSASSQAMSHYQSFSSFDLRWDIFDHGNS